jgi:glycosyltransferase involved in cell wall biosynthesis
MLRVAFVPQIPYFLGYAGFEVQLDRTLEALRERGVDAQRYDPWSHTLDADILHVFGTERQQQPIVERARARGIPTVVSAMYMRRMSGLTLKAWNALERITRIPTTQGLRRNIVQNANAIIALSSYERDELVQFLDAEPSKIHIIGNGVDQRFFTSNAAPFIEAYGVRDFVLSVGTVEPRKNQVRLIQALGPTGIPLVVLGSATSLATAEQERYIAEVRALVAQYDSVTWIEGLPHDSPLLPAAYAAARVHVLASTVEAQGLVSAEAVAAGASIVVSDLPNLRSFFGDSAWYADPTHTASIKAAVEAAWQAPRGQRTAVRPTWLRSWDDVAAALVEVYTSIR